MHWHLSVFCRCQWTARCSAGYPTKTTYLPLCHQHHPSPCSISCDTKYVRCVILQVKCVLGRGDKNTIRACQHTIEQSPHCCVPLSSAFEALTMQALFLLLCSVPTKPDLFYPLNVTDSFGLLCSNGKDEGEEP